MDYYYLCQVLDMFDESWSKELKENDTFNCINDIVICEKYIVRNQTSNTVKKEGKRKNKIKVEKLKIDSFKEHKDTVHFFKHLHSFNDNDVITINKKNIMVLLLDLEMSTVLKIYLNLIISYKNGCLNYLVISLIILLMNL